MLYIVVCSLLKFDNGGIVVSISSINEGIFKLITDAISKLLSFEVVLLLDLRNKLLTSYCENNGKYEMISYIGIKIGLYGTLP
jgi:hypothetical protein